MVLDSDPTEPPFFQVIIYFDHKGFELKDAETFFNAYNQRSWKGKKGIPVKNWRTKALDWMWQRQKNRPYLRTKSRLMLK